MLDGDPWKEEIQKDKNLKGIVDNLRNGWNSWAGGEDGAAIAGGNPQKTEKGRTDWNPKLPFKIDITTHFDENWFKRKYKSGILNGIVNAVKTQAMKRSVGTAAQSSMSGHVYNADTMEPGDKRKLDSIQWKMTNKVAKDYITYLLGWSRKKEAERKDDKSKTIEPTSKLSPDTGVGSSFAKKALGGRGILGRLRQKLFAGGQANNKISVAFQVADWRDGWKIVDEKTGEVISTGEEGNDGKDEGKGGGEAGKGGSGSGKGGGAAGSGAGGGKGTGGNGAGGKAANLDGKELKNLMTLLQRVIRLEDEVGVGPGSKGQNVKNNDADKDAKNGNKSDTNTKDTNTNKDMGGDKEVKPTNESLLNDPFFDREFLEDTEQFEKVREACEGVRGVNALVDDFIQNLV